MQVLMIEDNPNDFLLVTRFLAKYDDITLDWCNTLEKGLTFLTDHAVDALLLDMLLPDGEGLDVFTRVQSRFPTLPVVILSGHEADELALDAVRHGAQDYLIKRRVDDYSLTKALRYAIERKQLEDRLRRSDELHRAFAHNFPNGALLLYDHNLRYTLVDGRGLAELGLTKETMEGKTIWDVFPIEMAEAGAERMQTALMGGSVSQEITYAGHNIEMNYVPIKGGDGSVLCGMIMSQNMTHRRRAEEQFRSAFTYAAIGMALVSLDGHWLQVNRAVCDMIGYSEQELLTKTFQDITHPDDLETDLHHVNLLLSGEIETYQMEKRYFHKLGHQVWGLLSVSLVHDSAGNPLHFISQIQDITQRKQAELELAAERNLLRTMIDSSPDYIFIKDTQGRFILSNVAHTQAAAFSPEAVINKTVTDIFPKDIAQQLNTEDEQVIQSGQPLVNVERTIVTRNGIPKIVLTTKIPFHNSNGQVISMMGISRDITEHKKLEAQAIELATERSRTQALQRFIGNMSHDFRTPLSIISTSLYLLMRSSEPQKREIYLRQAEQQIQRLDKILEEFLPMQRLDGDYNFQFTQTEVNALIYSIVREYETLATSKDIFLEFASTVPSCFAHIDPIEFARAVTKLMDNALTYTPIRGHITVQTGIEDHWIVISIQDTGIGIAPANIPHIFEQFYRADQARSTETGGSGLGLAIVQNIVKAHAGSVEVQSTLGEGSTFTIRLPVREQANG